MVISINDYFVDPIVTHHFKITHLFFSLMVNSKQPILGPATLPHILILYSCLILLQLKVLF